MNKNLEIFEINLLINFNVIKCCHLYKIKKCISCLSTCIFPDKVEYPLLKTHNTYKLKDIYFKKKIGPNIFSFLINEEIEIVKEKMRRNTITYY